jgi:Mn-dependent DtxR family transcriptional regulator
MPRRPAATSVQAEDYLERIHELVEVKGYARVSDIATALKLSRPSVSAMVRRLSQSGYLTFENYRGLALTEKGRRLARHVRERHLVLKDFFELLGVEESVAFEDAEGIEHCISGESLEKFAALTRYWRKHPARLRHFLQAPPA